MVGDRRARPVIEEDITVVFQRMLRETLLVYIEALEEVFEPGALTLQGIAQKIDEIFPEA